MTMNERTLRSLLTGMENIRYRDYEWNNNVIAEALYVLENEEELRRDYDCYDHLFQ